MSGYTAMSDFFDFDAAEHTALDPNDILRLEAVDIFPLDSYEPQRLRQSLDTGRARENVSHAEYNSPTCKRRPLVYTLILKLTVLQAAHKRNLKRCRILRTHTWTFSWGPSRMVNKSHFGTS